MVDLFVLPDRKECPGGACPVCGSTVAIITTINGQDVVRCSCGKWLYNAPKTETGRRTRSLSTTHEAIKPKQRTRIIERANARCEVCGSRLNLNVGHVVSVADGHRMGLGDDLINSDENLICQCGECNSGTGGGTVPLRMYVTILKARTQGAK